MHKFKMTGMSEMDKFLEQLNNGADIDIKDNKGYTSLIMASSFGAFDIVKHLIKAGADINAKNCNGDTALIWASYKLSIKLVNLLLEYGADVNIQNEEGNTALMKIFENKYESSNKIVICKLLLASNADICLKNKKKKTIIDLIKKENLFSEIDPYKIVELNYLKDKLATIGEDINNYLDIFDTVLYSKNIERYEVKANIDMFFNNVLARIDSSLNENEEL